MTGNLPSPSGVGLGILQLTTTDDFTLADLAQTISADPALSGRILKLANSAMVAGAEPVADVLSASKRLGVRSVRSVALGFSLISANRSGVCADFDYNRYWSLSLSSAVLAQSVAKETGACCPSEAFTCALLSRVGMLALASVHPNLYSKTLRSTRGSSLDVLLSAETGAFEITHAEVTAALLRDWRLPESFCDVAIGLGQDKRSAAALPIETVRLLSTVNAAWMLAPRLVVPGQVEEILKEENLFLNGVAEVSFLEVVELRRALVESADAWDEWKGMLNLKEAPARRKRAKAEDAPQEEAMDAKPDLSDLLEEEEESVSIDPLVLIVDDDDRIVRLLQHYLKKGGFRTISANDGKRALDLAAEHQPQIIITDWMMPEMTGVELCQKLKQSESLRSAYVIMLTAEEAIGSIEEGFSAGVDDYICKPFKSSILMARVRSAKRVLELQMQLEKERDIRTGQMATLGAMTRKLRSVTMTDMLTELPNRRYAGKRLREEWAASVSRDKRLSLVMIDIDNFKEVNDRYGHDAGDCVLRETALVLMENTRSGDVICRFGGEEFLLINVDCDRETAMQCCERLRAAVEANRISSGEFEGNVTISLGVAERTDEIESVDALLKAADEAVYRAKRFGRNRIDDGESEGARRSA